VHFPNFLRPIPPSTAGEAQATPDSVTKLPSSDERVNWSSVRSGKGGKRPPYTCAASALVNAAIGGKLNAVEKVGACSCEWECPSTEPRKINFTRPCYLPTHAHARAHTNPRTSNHPGNICNMSKNNTIALKSRTRVNIFLARFIAGASSFPPAMCVDLWLLGLYPGYGGKVACRDKRCVCDCIQATETTRGAARTAKRAMAGRSSWPCERGQGTRII
jgi:hypothetical protein